MQKLELNSPIEIKLKIQEYFRKNEEARFIHRLHGILLKIDKKDIACESIAELFGQSGRTISNWISKVNKTGGLDVLRDKEKPGRTRRLNAIQLAKIKEILQLNPELSGVSSNIWDGKSLSFYIEKEFKIILGTRQCQRLFTELGFSLKRARPIVSKGDPLKKEVSKKT